MYKSEIKLFKSINKILMTKLVILGEEGEGGSSISFIEHLNSCKSSQIIQDCRPLTQVTDYFQYKTTGSFTANFNLKRKTEIISTPPFPINLTDRWCFTKNWKRYRDHNIPQIKHRRNLIFNVHISFIFRSIGPTIDCIKRI